MRRFVSFLHTRILDLLLFGSPFRRRHQSKHCTTPTPTPSPLSPPLYVCPAVVMRIHNVPPCPLEGLEFRAWFCLFPLFVPRRLFACLLQRVTCVWAQLVLTPTPPSKSIAHDSRTNMQNPSIRCTGPPSLKWICFCLFVCLFSLNMPWCLLRWLSFVLKSSMWFSSLKLQEQRFYQMKQFTVILKSQSVSHRLSWLYFAQPSKIYEKNQKAVFVFEFLEMPVGNPTIPFHPVCMFE